MFPDWLRSSDGLALRTHRSQPPAVPPRARVIVVHGLGDHCEGLPCRNLTSALVPGGFSVYAFDLRGHGRSDGPRMFTHAWDTLRHDLGTFVHLVQRDGQGGPLFLIGISLGGLLVLNHAQHHPAGIAGIVAVAPAVDASGVPPLIRLVTPVLSRLVPRMALDPGLDLAAISRDRAAAEEYTSDPAFQTRTTARLAGEALKAMADTHARAARLRLPLLILHGTEDAIIPPSGSARFFARVPAPDKERRTYAGAGHNLFIELNRDEVFADIIHWLERHLG